MLDFSNWDAYCVVVFALPLLFDQWGTFLVVFRFLLFRFVPLVRPLLFHTLFFHFVLFLFLFGNCVFFL